VADPYEEGIKAASKAEFITVPPDAKFLSGPTYRDKIRGALDFIGVDDRGKNVLVGDMRSDSFIDNIGLLDLTPIALPAVIQEGSRAFKRGDYGEAALDLGFSALEMFPGAKLLTKPARNFFSSLASKFSKSTDDLGSLPTDESRRTFMAGAAATPVVAGTLGDLPIAKMIDDVAPVAKKIPVPINLRSLGSFKRRMDEAVDMAIDEGREFDSELIETMDTNDFMEEIIDSEMGSVEDFEGSFLEEMIDEIRKTSPESTDQEIFDILSESISDLDELVPTSKLNYKASE